MRTLLVVVLSLGLAGCAQRYLRITAAPVLKCEDELKVKQRPEDPIWYRVSGCGRTVYCQQLIWAGADEWACQQDDPAAKAESP